MTVPHAGPQAPAESDRAPSPNPAAPAAEAAAREPQSDTIADASVHLLRSRFYTGGGPEAEELGSRIAGANPQLAETVSLDLLREITRRVLAAESRDAYSTFQLVDESARHFAALDAQRDARLAELLFAARNLAKAQLVRLSSNLESPLRLCVVCNERFIAHLPFHRSTCLAGRVLGLIEELEKLEPTLNRKEAAQEPEDGRAGGWKHPRDSFGEPWEYRLDDVLQTVTMYDREGTRLIEWPRANREVLDWAARIRDCVNSYAELEGSFAGSKGDSVAMLIDACRAQHDALDALFSRLCTLDAQFVPSRSGQPWEALVKGVKAVTFALHARKGGAR